MSDNTSIEWADATWNPLIGCTPVSAGCDHCYAEKVVNRWHKATDGAEAWPAPFSTVSVRPDRFLTQPLRWTRPRRVFVNSLSDLFHKDVPDETIARVWAVMALAPQHTFQVLTKRHARMRALLSSEGFRRAVWAAIEDLPVQVVNYTSSIVAFEAWPLPNVWLGVSVENQQWADNRIPALLDTPAAVRWISAEPLLGPLDLPRFCACGCSKPAQDVVSEVRRTMYLNEQQAEASVRKMIGLDWVVVGGESGPGSRPMHPDWARNLRDQCTAADVPFLFKQWGDWAPYDRDLVRGGGSRSGMSKTPLPSTPDLYVKPDGSTGTTSDFPSFIPPTGWAHALRVGKRVAGRHLDGQLHDGYPT